MKNTIYHMLYLAACGIQQVKPDVNRLEQLDVEALYKLSRMHYLEALVGMSLQKAGISLPKEWTDAVSKAIRKVILFDAERTKILSFMESKGIWHMPLKGVVLKDLYPALGMRQMSDNDILFDAGYADVLKVYMTEQGYKTVSFGTGNHDSYEKEPVFNFELHRSLHRSEQNKKYGAYYENVKERLIRDADSEYGYHFSEEDFYVYMITHEHKHYMGGGTGLRSLLDVYVYLGAKGEAMDMDYVRRECEQLDVAEFEERGRVLAEKVFSNAVTVCGEDLIAMLTPEEQEMLEYYLTSGVYGTTERMMTNRISKFEKETGSRSKLKYIWNRIFPPMERYKEYFPFFYKHKWLLPVGWLYRALRAIFVGKRRKNLSTEIKVLQKSTKV